MLSEVTEITIKHLISTVKKKNTVHIQYFSKRYVCIQLAMSVLIILISILSKMFYSVSDIYMFAFIMVAIFSLISGIVNVVVRFELDNADQDFEFESDNSLIKSFSILVELANFIKCILLFKYINFFISILLILYHVVSFNYLIKCLFTKSSNNYEISAILKIVSSIFVTEISSLIEIINVDFNYDNKKLIIYVKELPTKSVSKSIASISNTIENYIWVLYKRTPYYYEFVKI